MTARGCPYSCTYCCNNLFKRIYKNKGRILRYRSNENVISELENVLSKYPFIDLIQFFDDDFISGRLKNLTEFTEMYKYRIGLPFKINTTPTSINNSNIDSLIDAGLVAMEIGLQSASEYTNNSLYKRKFEPEKFFETAKLLSGKQIRRVYYDLILDNPYESVNDLSTTFRYIAKLPMPFMLNLFSLTFYPGTFMYDNAVRDGIIKDVESQVYDKTDNTVNISESPYIKVLLFLLKLTKRRNFFPVPIIYSLTGIRTIQILNSKYLKFFWEMLLKLKIWIGMNIKR